LLYLKLIKAYDVLFSVFIYTKALIALIKDCLLNRFDPEFKTITFACALMLACWVM